MGGKMGASSVTGVGQSSAVKTNPYRSSETNPRVVSAGLLTLDGDGYGTIFLLDFYGTLIPHCEGNECSWQATLQLSVGTSYYDGSGDYAQITWIDQSDDPTFTHQEYLAGTAQKPTTGISFYGEPEATISYIVTTTGNRA